MVASLLKDKEKTSDDNSNHLVRRVPSSVHIRTPTPTPIINFPPVNSNHLCYFKLLLFEIFITILLLKISVITNTPYKCLLLDWVCLGDVIAKGRWSFNDPSILIQHCTSWPQRSSCVD
ncbi:hypothetical protein IC575_028456 [Cucumis melo]